MKKLISILLCIIMIFSSVAVTAFAADELKIIVANDLHLSLNSYKPYTGNNSVDAWAHVVSSGQLSRESNAIITAFLENAAESDADAILLPGDLVDTGSEEEHLLMAEKLADFEKETGKSVYVVPGNHDLFKSSVSEFVSIYADFGYNEALAKAETHASYTVDIDDEYRLLAIDSILPGESVEGVSEEKIEWITAQLEKAASDKKKVIAMMHHNLLEHFILGSVIHPGAVVKANSFADILADNGVKFIFTGHTHDQDIASHMTAKGNTIYDVVTNTINAYPCSYREVSFDGSSVKLEAKKVEKINVSLLPEGISDEALALAQSDFTQYTEKTIWIGLRKTFNSYLNGPALIRLIGIDKETDPYMHRIITDLGDKLSEIVQMPFSNDDGTSMKDIAAKYSKTLPESDYEDLIDLAITLYQAHCIGDEYYAINSTEVNLLMTAVETVLCYCLEDVSAEDYAAVLKFIINLTGATVPDNILGFAGGIVERIEGINLVVSSVLRPMVTHFTTDDSPADNNVVLEGYEEFSGVTGFLEAIREFFRKIADFLRKLFAFIPVG